MTDFGPHKKSMTGISKNRQPALCDFCLVELSRLFSHGGRFPRQLCAISASQNGGTMESLYLCSLSVSDLLQDFLIVWGPILAKCCVYKENLSSDPNKSTCWDLRGYHAGLLGISAMRGQILY